MSLTQRHLAHEASEDQMEVGHGEQVLLAPREPALARLCLTLRAVPVAAGVIRDGLMSAAHARIAMTTECSGYGSERSHRAPCAAARLTKRYTVAGSCHH